MGSREDTKPLRGRKRATDKRLAAIAESKREGYRCGGDHNRSYRSAGRYYGFRGQSGRR
jgi:hypothetical protein